MSEDLSKNSCSNSLIDRNALILKSAAQGYITAMISHWNSVENPNLEYDYLFMQAEFVRRNSVEVSEWLTPRISNSEIDHKHLQYFFPVLPPVFTPYMELWSYIAKRLAAEGFEFPSSLLSCKPNDCKRIFKT